MEIKDIKDLILAIDKTSIEKVDIEKGDIKISISKSSSFSHRRTNEFDEPKTEIVHEEIKKENNEIDHIIKEDSEDVYIVKSPIVGTFYSSPSPDEEPFAKVGEQVKEGQALCIIEAMKVMNEIEAEISGSVIEILVENEEIVQYGQPLMKIRR